MGMKRVDRGQNLREFGTSAKILKNTNASHESKVILERF
jgi:hypothetical protein